VPPGQPNAATITVREALQLLDAQFADFAAGVNEGEYALWLGSGISRGRVVGLNGVLRKIIEFLRTRIATVDVNCAFRLALDHVLTHAVLSEDEQARVNYDVDSAQWPDIETILERLAERYSRVLDVSVTGQAADYLLWVAADFCQTFANQEPDAEHLCIVIMVAEGAVPVLVSANWDGLLEGAARELGLGPEIFRVCVTGEDFRGPLAAARLLKFHGCALRAIENDAQYRPLLIARWSQIVNWAVNNAFTAMREELVGVAAQMRTLMIGMSAQDPNAQSLFQLARQRTAWRWDDAPPAHVFGTNEIGEDQKTVLRTAYGEADYTANQQYILERSCFRAYGKPLLAALVLNMLSDKLCKLFEHVEMPSRQESDLQELSSGIRHLRDAVGAAVSENKLGFVRSLARHLSRAKAMLQEGRPAIENPVRYRPITNRPGHHILNDPNVVATGQGEAAKALALLGLGMRDGHWDLALENLSDRRSGVLRARSQLREARLMFVAHDNADVRLFNEGAYSEDDDDVVIVHSMDPGERQTRSPAKRLPGARVGPRHVAIGKLARECQNLDELRTLFRQEVGL
jgi:hypothetical protein